MFNAGTKGLYLTEHILNTWSKDDTSPLPSPSFYRLTLSQHSISFVEPIIWNDLPTRIININLI